MAGMKRFVTYIYSYEEGKKGSNIGFAKIEIRGEDCRIEIHLRGVYATHAACSVYLFRVISGRIEGIPVGEMRLIGGKGDFGVIVKAGHIANAPLGIGDMEGIVLLGGDEQIFLSRWKEGEPFAVSQDNFVKWQPDRPEAEEVQPEPATAGGKESPQPADSSQAAKPVENTERVQSQPSVEELTVPVPDAVEKSGRAQPESVSDTMEKSGGAQPESVSDIVEKSGETQPELENLQATELPVRNIFPAYDWREVWEKLQQEHPVFMPFADQGATCIQIELKDIRELPRRYWYLGNNSFLLHGFFNYRYLLVGKTGEERWFLGVPGIYQRQERVMAAIFGFPGFLPAAVSGEGNTREEPINRFGCWFRYIEE